MIFMWGAQVFVLFVHLVHIKHDFYGGGGAQVLILFVHLVHIKHDFCGGGGTSFHFVCPFGSH